MSRIGVSSKRAPRVDVRQAAVLINSDGTEHNVILLDISSAGCRIEVDETPRRGEKVIIRDAHGAEFAAEIRWALGREAGMLFLVPTRI